MMKENGFVTNSGFRRDFGVCFEFEIGEAARRNGSDGDAYNHKNRCMTEDFLKKG